MDRSISTQLQKPKSKNLRSYLDFRINRIIFLVKNAINPSAHSLFYTQHLLPDVKPLHVFYRGLNFTRFLTGQQHLTNFTYQVLATLSSEYGWTFRDVRSFFNISFKSKHIKRITSSLATPKIQKSTPVSASRIAFQSAGFENKNVSDTLSVVPSDPKPIASSDKELIKRIKTSQSIPIVDENVKPLLRKRRRSSSPSDVPLSQRLCLAQAGDSSNPQTDGQQRHDNNQSAVDNSGQIDLRTARLFSKFQNFSAALKLVALNILPDLRFPQTRFELYYGLMMEGFDEDVLARFKSYLAVKFPPLLTAKGLHQVVNEYVKFGGIAIDDKTVHYDQELSLIESKESMWFGKITY